MDINIKISRLNHWEITFENDLDEKQKEEVLDKIIKSDELFNSNKERVFNTENQENEKEGGTAKLLVRYTEDFVGQSKTQILKNSFKIKGLKSIKKGVVWNISGKTEEVQKAVNCRIFFNKFSQKAFWKN
jgi:hypothetical protein